jgi:hypothetical protein
MQLISLMLVEGLAMVSSAASVKSDYTNVNGSVVNVGGSTVDSNSTNGNGRSELEA